MNYRNTTWFLASGLGVLALTGVACADDISSGYSSLEKTGRPLDQHEFQVNPGYTHFDHADFDDSGLGHMRVRRMDLPIRYTLKTEPGDLRLGLYMERVDYDLGDFDEDLEFYAWSFDALWQGRFDEHWGYFVYGDLTVAHETSENIDDAATGMGALGGRYTWSPNLSLGLGVAVASRLEDDLLILPVITLNWQINERLRLRTLRGATLTYDLTADKKWQVDLGVEYQRREYRVRDDESFTERMVRAELGATYHFSRHVGLRGFMGMAAGREVELRTSDHKIRDEDVDPAPFFGARALFTF